MGLATTLAISAAMLGLLLLILLIVWAMAPAPRKRGNNSESAREDMKHIKEEVEHEAMEEVAPYKTARLSRPSKKRL